MPELSSLPVHRHASDASFQPANDSPRLLVSPLTAFTLAAVLSLGVGTMVVPGAFAQIINPATPAPGSDPQSSPTLTIKTETRRVAVDIVVTDPKGKPVTNLTKQDFSVFEDNTPQTIHDFELHTITSQPDYVLPKMPKLPPNTFVNLATAPPTGTPTVLLYDVLNTPVKDQQYAHEEMIRFLKHRRPGVQVAIFVLGSKLQMLQGFTDDETQLEAALVRKKGQPSSSLLLGGDPGATNAAGILSDTDPSATATAGISTAPGAGVALTETEISDGLTHMESLDQSAILDERVDITLQALTQIGRFLSGLPGRKNLIWLSASFPSNILPDATLSATAGDHDQSIRNYSAEIKEATDLLSLSHVAVYPVDVRAVVSNDTYLGSDASTNQTFNPGATSFASNSLKATQSIAAERGTMDSIADSTGGHAFYNVDLQDAVSNAISSGSTYYSLTYSPTNPNFDGSLRKIKVKLQEAGYTLAYRKTYFADDTHKAIEEAEDAPITPLGNSLEHGTPLSHDLFIEAHVDVYGDPMPATPQQMDVLSKYEAFQTKKKSKGPLKPLPAVLMQRYVIEYGLLARQLDLPAESAGAHHSLLEVGVISYDADGKKLNGLDNRIDDTIPAARFAHLQDVGYHVVQTVAVPVNASSLRLAVRDVLANRVGSLEVNLPLASTASPLHSLDSGAPVPPGSSSK